MMDKYREKQINLLFDCAYNLKSKGVNNKLEGYLNLLMDSLNEYVKEYNKEFRLNQKSQKFKLYKIK